MNAFHAYDIRGVYDVDFNKEDAYKVGFFLPKLLQTKKILVGRDARVSSPEIFEYLTNGITDAGADVYNVGLSTTPMVYFSTAKFEFEASVMITASHNAKQYNGMKISRENALPVGFDTGLGELQKMMQTQEIVISVQKGKIIEFEVKDKYLEFLSSYIPDFSDLRISVDCSNGMAGLFIRTLLGDKPNYIYEELDGTFPNHDANPLVLKNVKDLMELVKQEKSDIGIIFDGDADRVMFVDENGEFISPDLMIALFGHYFLEGKDTKAKVLQDIRTSKAVGEYLKQFGAEIHTWRVGRAYAALKLREIDGLFGGELAGHYYFKDFYYSDSGLLACLIVLDILAKKKKEGKTLSELVRKVKAYANSGEINYKIERKLDTMNAVREAMTKTETPTASFDFDGYRVEFPDWWFNIRPSNTEPYLRLLAEAKTEELLEEKLNQIKAIIAQFQ